MRVQGQKSWPDGEDRCQKWRRKIVNDHEIKFFTAISV